MAANKTVTRAATTTLAVDTAYTINITADSKAFIEVVHHNDAPQPIYISIASTEAALAALTLAGDNQDVIAAGERITFSGFGKNKWIRLFSHGIPTVTVAAIQ